MDIDLEELERVADYYEKRKQTMIELGALKDPAYLATLAEGEAIKAFEALRPLVERVRELEQQREALAFWLAQFLPHAECPIFEDCPLSHKKNVDVRDCAKQLIQGVLDHD